MYPYSWQWSYTVIALTLLLAVFFLSCAVLLLRRSPRRWHRTPERISTPYGQVGYWDIVTQEMLAQGIERARHRQYSMRGRER